jgi:hypothetical protein
MENQSHKGVVASLEGMKVVTALNSCEFHEYNFETNTWHEIETCGWPMRPEHAVHWLQGWNSVDRMAALALLTTPEGE